MKPLLLSTDNSATMKYCAFFSCLSNSFDARIRKYSNCFYKKRIALIKTTIDFLNLSGLLNLSDITLGDGFLSPKYYQVYALLTIWYWLVLLTM